jgi:hypothetical protein
VTETPDAPQAHGVHIDAQPGSATITLAGTPIDPGTVTGYVLEHAVAEALPMLILHTRQPDHVSFDGLARVAVGVHKSPGDLVAAFLAEIDPVLLEQTAMNRADYGGEAPTARAMLATLAEWANGRKAGD